MGIGYELYSRGLDRIVMLSSELDSVATRLSRLTRKNETRRKRIIQLNKMKKLIASIDLEYRSILQDFDNLEGYTEGSGMNTINVKQKR